MGEMADYELEIASNYYSNDEINEIIKINNRFRKYIYNRNNYHWKQKNGKIINLDDIDDNYLLNIENMLKVKQPNHPFLNVIWYEKKYRDKTISKEIKLNDKIIKDNNDVINSINKCF